MVYRTPKSIGLAPQILVESRGLLIRAVVAKPRLRPFVPTYVLDPRKIFIFNHIRAMKVKIRDPTFSTYNLNDVSKSHRSEYQTRRLKSLKDYF